MTSKSQIATDPDWLHNAHAGEMLLSEFMEPLGLTIEEIAERIAVPVERIRSVIDGERPVDGELDLRLGRYLGMSEGFFLRLQDQYELLEAKRALKDDLDRIVPRAA